MKIPADVRRLRRIYKMVGLRSFHRAMVFRPIRASPDALPADATTTMIIKREFYRKSSRALTGANELDHALQGDRMTLKSKLRYSYRMGGSKNGDGW